MERQPCPERIFDDLGSAFSMGVVAGTIFHFVRGCINGPRGGKFKMGLTTMKQRAPILGGAFAVWGGTFSTVDCSLLHIRKKEGMLNSVIAGAVTGGVISFRGGWKAISRGALVGGVFLALIESAGILVNKVAEKAYKAQAAIPPPPKTLPPHDSLATIRDTEFDLIPTS